MSGSSDYNKKFFKRNTRRTEHAVKVFSRFIKDVLDPSTVVDVGCARGQYLAELKRLGVREITGVDGTWVNKSDLLIPREDFLTYDLKKSLSGLDALKGPGSRLRRFDLAICLETAEHIEKEYADTLVSSLTSLSDMIFFSAAIPFQWGEHHVNCQWQSYWAEKFARKGYNAYDIRHRFWDIEEIPSFYRQNVLVYAHKNAKIPKELREDAWDGKRSLNVVHPETYELFANPRTTPYRTLLSGMKHVPGRAFKKIM